MKLLNIKENRSTGSYNKRNTFAEDSEEKNAGVDITVSSNRCLNKVKLISYTDEMIQLKLAY